MGREGTRAIGAIPLPVRRLHVELTNRCNFRCEFCADGRMRRPRGSMPFSVLESIVADAVGAVTQIHLHLMGEPMLFPRLDEAVRLIRSHGLIPCLTTNGSLLSPRAAASLAESGLGRLTVSLQTPDPESYPMRGAGGLSYSEYRDRIVETLRFLLSGSCSMQTDLVFLANPLFRFFAPDPPRGNVPTHRKELRERLDAWAEEIVRGTSHEARLPDIRRRIRKAGVLKENVIPLSDDVSFRVRILGNWADHFALPIVPARFGFCPGLAENFGILWNGDYVICCTDFDGETVVANYGQMKIRDYLANPYIQEIAEGFRRFRVVHPHCGVCLGERGRFHGAVRQFGSIIYFKIYRRLLRGGGDLEVTV